MSKVSVIMPVYNAERYLREAIDSVLRQTYTDFELLLINDRSSDNSGAICKEYGEKDDRIVLLENDSAIHGPGPTRNIGLDHATGEYIYFMDADDWIEDRLLQCAVERMQETGADIVQFGVVYEWNDGKEPFQHRWAGKPLLEKEDIKKDFLFFWKNNSKNLWLHFFRRKVVENIRFENIINGEDVSYLMDALCKAERIAYISEVCYHYRYVKGSTCHRWIKETVECLEILWKHQCGFIKTFSSDIQLLAYTMAAYDNYMWAIYQLSSMFCPLNYREKRRELSKLKKIMEFDVYRKIYPISTEHGLIRLKFILVRYHLEGIILLFGPLFYKIVCGDLRG